MINIIPQIIIVSLYLIGLGVNITRHGENKKPSKYCWWSHLIAILFNLSILYYGGFFDVIKL